MLSGLIRRIQQRAFHEVKNRGYLRDFWYPKYNFQMFPKQLCFLAECIKSTKEISGSIFEVGCAHGLTTTFLYEYMTESGFKKDYICIDTFNGFTKDDLRVEFSDRDNRHSWIIGLFKDNDPDWFKHSLAQRGIVDVAVIASDISTLDPLLLPERIAFCLLDVDLYQPVKVGLEKIYPRLSPGGIIVVDDCWSKSRHLFVEGVAEAYDGAMQAYREFVSTEGLPEELVETKFGIIRKPG